jgi:hypothetical protein
MRTTIDLPADLHRVVTSIAAHTKRSMNQTVADLIRRGLEPSGGDSGPAARNAMKLDPLTGLPVIRSSRPVTADDVRALDDD